MRAKEKSKDERLRAAAIVKLKYQLLSGGMDKGFQTVFDGVLGALSLTEDEVDTYIESNREELVGICLRGHEGR
jgi:hypothetical protein